MREEGIKEKLKEKNKGKEKRCKKMKTVEKQEKELWFLTVGKI